MTLFPKIFLNSGKRRGRGSCDPGDTPATYSKLTEGACFLRDQGSYETADMLWHRSSKKNRACLRPRFWVKKKPNLADQTPNPGSRNLQVSMRGTKLGPAVHGAMTRLPSTVYPSRILQLLLSEISTGPLFQTDANPSDMRNQSSKVSVRLKCL